METFVVGIVSKWKDTEKQYEYKKLAMEALEKHGGKLVLPATPGIQIDGNAENPEAFILLSFPSSKAAENWRDDPELSDLHALRHATGDISMFILNSDK